MLYTVYYEGNPSPTKIVAVTASNAVAYIQEGVYATAPLTNVEVRTLYSKVPGFAESTAWMINPVDEALLELVNATTTEEVNTALVNTMLVIESSVTLNLWPRKRPIVKHSDYVI